MAGGDEDGRAGWDRTGLHGPGVPFGAGAVSRVGQVTAVGGSQASVALTLGTTDPSGAGRATVGTFLGLETGRSLLVAVVTEVSLDAPRAGAAVQTATARVDLLGEIRNCGSRRRFQRGVTDYPLIGDGAVALGNDDLRLVFDAAGPTTVEIGHLQQDGTIPAYVDVDAMVRKHFALLGTTGVGKSCGVALLIDAIMARKPELRVFLIDPHNEYGRSFGDRAEILTPSNLRLPFWLFNFEEIVDVFFRGRPGIEEEVEILRELIPVAKSNFAANRAAADRLSIRKADARPRGYTADTPVPYRLSDLLSLIDERLGRLENKAYAAKYSRLITRIETVRNDPRYVFMFDNANVGGDTMAEVVSDLFRLAPRGKPMTIMQLAGFPAEVVDSVVSVLCRMAFEFGLWSDGAVPILFVCEEAHRYAPADRSIGFGPTRKAVSRIAKEGRKYGVFLGLVTQRPAELDPTIISQCSTLFAMPIPHDRDQAIVRAAVSDAAASLLGFVPALGIREVFAFGEGVALPTRLRFRELPARMIPHGEAQGRHRIDPEAGLDELFLGEVLDRWRGATMGGRSRGEDRGPDPYEVLEPLPPAEPAPTSPPAAPGADPRGGFLQRNAGFRPDLVQPSGTREPVPRWRR